MRLRQAPLAAAACWFAAGIVLEHWQASRTAYAPTILVLTAVLLLAFVAILALRTAVAWLPVAGVWVALGLAAALWHPSPPRPVTLLSYADNLSRKVQGRVIRIRKLPGRPAAESADLDAVPPWESAEAAPSDSAPVLSIDLAIDHVEDVTPDRSTMVAADGGVRISVYGDSVSRLNLACSDRIEVPLRMKLPDTYRDPGAFASADALLAQGIAARASVDADRLLLQSSSTATLACRLASAQAWASGRLQQFVGSAENRHLPQFLRLGQPDAQMLDAMLFGDRAGLNHSLRTSFERTGTFHLFVVSGLHIALLAGGVFWLLRRLHLPPWLATAGTLLATCAYAALTGFGQPAQRALAMTAVFLLTRLLSREHDRMPLNALGAAALAMLVWAPGSLFEASFQMTMLAIVAIAGIAVPLGNWTFLRHIHVTREVFERHGNALTPQAAQLRMMLELWGSAVSAVVGPRSRKLPAVLVRWTLLTLELALVGTLAELVMVLPMAMYFHRAALFALPANMVVIPVIALLAPVAVATFAASLVSPWLALLPASLTAALLHTITFAIRHVSHLDAADLRVPGPVWWVAVLAILLWGGCCWMVRRSQWGALLTALAVPAIAAMLLWPEPAVLHPQTLEVTAIDVGQGDSLLAVNPERGTMLIDAGGPVGGHGMAETVTNFDVGEQVVSPYLWNRRLRHLDVVVLTHAHTDHMGGMAAVLENFRPRELWTGIDPRSPLYAALLTQAARLGITVRHLHAGDRVQWGSVAVSVLAPVVSYRNLGAPRNNDSLVLRMELGKASVLLEGDAERASEDAMLAAGLAGPVTLLKVGHHGSKTSTNPEFAAAVQARDAVVSVGRSNTFGHPRGDVIARLAAGGTHLFRTDEFGLTTFLLARDGSIRAFAGTGEIVTVPNSGP